MPYQEESVRLKNGKYMSKLRTLFSLRAATGLLLAAFCGELWAYDCKVDLLYYQLDKTSHTATVVDCDKADDDFLGSSSISINGSKKAPKEDDSKKNVTVPETITYGGETYTVTTIGRRAFAGEHGFESVTLSANVDSIADNAFYANTDLKTVKMLGSVRGIGDYAFCECMELASVTLPKTLKYIGNHVFRTCPSLTSIKIPDSISYLGDGAFSNCTNLSSVTLPSSLKIIPTETFSGCSSLISINIPSTVFSIQDAAFYGSGLKSLVLPNTLSYIGIEAFRYCKNLTSINIPSSLREIKDYTFYGCESLTKPTIPGNINHISSNAFASCKNLEELTLEDGAVSLSMAANSFEGCKIKELYLGRRLEETGMYKNRGVFGTNIEKLTIAEHVNTIRDYEFYDCYLLESVSIPRRVYSVGNNTFTGCTGLKDMFIYSRPMTYDFMRPLSAYATVHAYKDQFTEIEKEWIGNKLVPIDEPYKIKVDKAYPKSVIFSVTDTGGTALPYSMGDVIVDGTTIHPDASGKYIAKDLTWNRFKSCEINVNYTLDGKQAFSQRIQKLPFPITMKSWSSTHTTITILTDSVADPYSKIPETGIEINGRKYPNEPSGKLLLTGLTPGTKFTLKPYAVDTLDGWPFTVYSENENVTSTSSMYLSTKSLTVSNLTATTLDCKFKFNAGDITVTDFGMIVNDKTYKGDTLSLRELDPGTKYKITGYVDTKEGGRYTTNNEFTTEELLMETLPATATSNTAAQICAKTNLTNSVTGTGFEWRRYDAPELVPSTKSPCPVVDSMLTGTLHNLSELTYYKYRPYYTSASGKTYYGDWLAFGTGDAYVYFEPTVRTYAPTSVSTTSAVLSGCAIGGSETIEEQGFEYWPATSPAKARKAAAVCSGGRESVAASGQWMSARIDNLTPNTGYVYRAYVTAGGKTTYGTELSFDTEQLPTGIDTPAEDGGSQASVEICGSLAKGTALIRVSGSTGTVVWTLATAGGTVAATGTAEADGQWHHADTGVLPAGVYLLTVKGRGLTRTLKTAVR